MWTLNAILFSLIISTNSFVKEFHALEGESQEQNFIDKYKNSSDPGRKGYIYSLQMKKAEYTLNPIEKLSIFNKYKSKLDQLIVSYPANIHLRYMRLTIQEKLPSLLGYNSNIKEDKKFLLSKLRTEDETDYMDIYIKANTSL